MTNITVVTTPPDLLHRLSAWPEQLDESMRTVHLASRLIMWENVPPYPTYESAYVRTGQLGRSLGVSEGGGKLGEPSIYKFQSQGRFFLG